MKISNNITLKERQVKRSKYIQKSKADSTLIAYRSDWKQFSDWCLINQLIALPAEPETVADYVITLAEGGYKYSSIRRKIASISQAHKAAEFMSPVKDYRVSSVLSGISNEFGHEESPKKAILLDELKLIMNQIELDRVIGLRDKAMLLLGFMSGCRRSELVTINIEDLQFTSRNLQVKVQQQKTHDSKLIIISPTHGSNCPIKALNEWLNHLELRGYTSGALFKGVDRHGNIISDRLTDKGVERAIKRYTSKAGLNPKDYAGHSLRRGFITAAKIQGIDDKVIMLQTGHKTRVMLDRYTDDAIRYTQDFSSLGSKLD